ncbi:predicted protein [Thalassiosira pseudonana CCMP1335]|uniref:Uncharacterized protein n=1 Tax=Thalassiosira pseudonana TaxID=35128 RepID=B8BTJ2_THAPS|nr:predicted protein [Thalassiosira pseudonana CCMP1335]EED95104.1 predicted protein [Thalassiosira pseudonana CCMP1335]
MEASVEQSEVLMELHRFKSSCNNAFGRRRCKFYLGFLSLLHQSRSRGRLRLITRRGVQVFEATFKEQSIPLLQFWIYLKRKSFFIIVCISLFLSLDNSSNVTRLVLGFAGKRQNPTQQCSLHCIPYLYFVIR